MTPLHWAVERGHYSVVVKLMEYGSNPNALSKFEKTPLIIALENGRQDIMDALQNTEVRVCRVFIICIINQLKKYIFECHYG
jgi:ankyrin repeat protein